MKIDIWQSKCNTEDSDFTGKDTDDELAEPHYEILDYGQKTEDFQADEMSQTTAENRDEPPIKRKRTTKKSAKNAKENSQDLNKITALSKMTEEVIRSCKICFPKTTEFAQKRFSE